MKLFAVMLGGTAPGANTELHDAVFAVGDTIESTYEQLMRQWFGCLLYTSPSPRDRTRSRMPSSA